MPSHFLAHFVKDLLHNEVSRIVAIKRNQNSISQSVAYRSFSSKSLVKNVEYQVAHGF